MNIVNFENLSSSDLVVDTIYSSGESSSLAYEPISKLIPKIGNMGGFRPSNIKGSKSKAFVVLFTTGGEIEWPDELDVETGLFRYFGDNKKPGKLIHEVPGNRILREIFNNLSAGKRELIPPFLLFESTGNKRDVRFLGLACPGHPNYPISDSLVALWKSKGGARFQNYEALFTILDTGDKPIKREWLKELQQGKKCSGFEPIAWREFVDKGIRGVRPLEAKKTRKYRTKEEQLPQNKADLNALKKIYKHFENPYDFEQFAIDIVQLMDPQFIDFKNTRSVKDGGIDGIGFYRIGPMSEYIKVDCYLEAKRYNLSNGVGVKETSRLISRIKNRQFGILVTTSYVSKQAYEEIIEDGHPILILSGKDIINVLKRTDNLDFYLTSNR